MNAKHSSQSNHIPAMLGDAVIVVLAFVSAMLGRFLFDRQINPLPGARFGNWNSAPGAVCLLLFLSAYLWTAQQYGLYSSRSSASRFHQITKTCQACLNACFVLSGGMFLVTVMPGVTGLWQVQSRQDNSFTKYIALDMEYIKNWSLLLDFKILLRTVDVVLRGTGV